MLLLQILHYKIHQHVLLRPLNHFNGCHQNTQRLLHPLFHLGNDYLYIKENNSLNILFLVMLLTHNKQFFIVFP